MNKIFNYFEELSNQKWTGLIEVKASEGIAFIHLKSGRFLFAHRPIDRSLERLEKIEGIELPPFAAVSAKTSWPEFVDVCLKINPAQTKRLIRYLDVDRFEIFFRIFFWSNLELTPKAQDSVIDETNQNNLFAPIKMEKLLNEVKARELEWPKIQDRLGSSRRIFVSTSKSPHKSTPLPDVIDQVLDEIPGQEAITIEEEMNQKIIDLCNGKNTVEDLIRNSYQGEFLVLRQILNLWDQGSIAPIDTRTKSLESPVTAFGVIQDLTKAVALGALVLICLSLIRRTPLIPIVNSVPQELHQALELHRVEHGRYPQDLQQLQQSKSFFVLEGQRYLYQPKGPNRYELKSREIR